MATEGVLRDFLLNFENCLDIEEKVKQPNVIWRTLLTKQELWENIVKCPFQADEFRTFLEQLDAEERKQYFFLGIECLTNFVQANFTGPDLPDSVQDFFDRTHFTCCYNKFLSLNNEEINANTKYPVLLAVAICIFKYCHIDPVLNAWWQMRSIIIHAQIMDEVCPALRSQADNLQRDAKTFNLEGHVRARFELEQAQLYLLFRNVQKIEEHLQNASNLLGLKYYLTGKLGKRMEYQQRDVAQLTVEVSMMEVDNIKRPMVNTFEIPADLQLQGERLNVPKFSEGPTEKKIFPNLEQILLLKIAQNSIISKPKDDLRYEEIQPFLDLILSQSNTWAVRATTLLVRCQMEANHKRTVERSMMQCEEVFHFITKEKPHALNRVGAVYATGLQPIWQTATQLANIMLNFGMVKESLDIYLELQLWEEVIVCYTILKLKHKAVEIIKQELEKNPSPKLLCLLGDATDDVNCYEQAWEMSKRRSSRVQRHWGNHFYEKKLYKDCIPHFERSVSINPMQVNVWLRLGYAALETENWQVSATAYRRYTTLEPGNFEAWNNLAKAYIKLGNKRSAHQALQDALSCNFDNWKVWDNLMVVSADLGRYSDVIRSYHRILDLKEKHLDLDVLKVLTYGACQSMEESENQATGNLLQKTKELLGRLTSIYPAKGYLWELYAILAPHVSLKMERLQRAFKCYTRGSWVDNPIKRQYVLKTCQKLAEIACSDEIRAADPFVNSVRLNLSSTIAAVKRSGPEENLALLKDVTSDLAKIIDKAKSVTVKGKNNQ